MASRQSDFVPFTWVSGSASSPVIQTAGFVLFNLITPASFEPTSVKFQAGDGRGNFYDVYDRTGTLLTVVTGASRATDMPAELASYPSFKIVSNAGGNPAADRACILSMRN